jgi:hypothetical protein
VPSPLETALFGRLIDHAPLFPPAKLPLAEALDDHRTALAGPHGWIVRRFVCPASIVGRLNAEPLALSVVLDETTNLGDRRIEAVEVPRAAEPVPFDGEVYVEGLAAEEAGEARVKVRCGPTPPPIDELANVVRSCRANGVPFKATAGLHHPVRRNGQHGFLNLLAAAIFGDEEAALAEDDPGAFRVAGEVLGWGDRTASIAEIERGRKLFVAFGSCSFSEPVDDLISLGYLAA